MLVAMWFAMIGCVMLVGFGLVILTFRQWLIDRDQRVMRTRDDRTMRETSDHLLSQSKSRQDPLGAAAGSTESTQRTESEFKPKLKVEDSVPR